jgi:Rieske Fe-S protein
MADSHHLDRRQFVSVVLTALGSIMGAVIGLPAIGYLISPATRVQKREDWIPLGALENFPVGTPTLVTFNRTTVNGWERTVNSYGVFVLRRSDTDVSVLSNLCTHLNCRVNWDEGRSEYVCPCHDAQFDINGKVLGGPPPRPLEGYSGERLRIEEGIVSIHFEEG